MGQTLSEPVVDKSSKSGQDSRTLYGVSAMQGWRVSMEDAHACELELKAENNDGTPVAETSSPQVSFFGVYDGHGGERVALYAGEHLHRIIARQDSFRSHDFEQALKDGFLATDRAILNDPRYEEEVSGCTASVAIMTGDTIYVGNSGDSRTVLGTMGRAKPLSYDHKPTNEAEKSRICAAGGFVDFGRVNGNLALSRAIGDFEFKKSAELPPESQIVTAFPDVSVHKFDDDDEFLVIACDGIWDCQSSQAVVEFVRRGIVAKQDLASICENMMDNCLASNSETGGVGCDNMTMVIVGLLKGRSKEDWYQHIADRVARGEGPCAPPEYAEFRGPGIHHYKDGSDDNMDMDYRAQGLGGAGSGRIILLGDGTEVLTDSTDSDMFENDEEDKDLVSQVNKGQASSRSEREGTPGPNAKSEPQVSKVPENAIDDDSQSSSSERSEAGGEPKLKQATDSQLSPEQARQHLEK